MGVCVRVQMRAGACNHPTSNGQAPPHPRERGAGADPTSLFPSEVEVLDWNGHLYGMDVQ